MLEPYEYEVAIEILGQSKQPLVNEIHQERNKDIPNEQYLKYLKARKSAIDTLIDELEPKDEYLIKRILDKSDNLRKIL